MGKPCGLKCHVYFGFEKSKLLAYKEMYFSLPEGVGRLDK